MQNCAGQGWGAQAGCAVGTGGAHLVFTMSLSFSLSFSLTFFLSPTPSCSWQGVGEPVSLGLAGCRGWGGGSWVVLVGQRDGSHRGCPCAGGRLSEP